jgi:mono/diheme cytochrome c family protein
MNLAQFVRAAAMLTCTALSLEACYAEPGPALDTSLDGNEPFGGAAGEGSTAGPPPKPAPQRPVESCWWARGSEAIPARAQVMQEPAPMTVTSTRPIPTADLYGRFSTLCGGCHVETSLGGFHIDRNTFSSIPHEKVLAVIRSDDPATYMPPAGTPGAKKWSERGETDGVRELAAWLDAWVAQGKRPDLFTIEEEQVADAAATSYRVSPETGSKLTNIGTCVPRAGTIGTQTSHMDRLDAMFAGLESTDENPLGLPQRLDQTDFVTVDSRVLAEYGVISFVPGYPLWSDGSAKMRHVRVPRGESIRFDAERQEFVIPANTRFYKTFLKKVIDKDGRESFRKMETRIIVSRPDTLADDGSATVHALFGTYAWNDDESAATLVQDPLRNGLPFQDRLFSYFSDEQKANAIIASQPRNPLYELQQAGILKHYAIPGKERCIHCHMGSMSESFVLGFTPLQLARRATGDGGAIEHTGEDEFSQLQRLIDYGVVTGIQSPAEVTPLEESQGDRKARTNQELVAQGYMYGNCAHCHNPRGFPSTRSPELKELLDFYPHKDGGIFEFPLDRMSPRIKRGPGNMEEIPYITPSLRELPLLSERADDVENWTPKYFIFPPTEENTIGFSHIDAPWRSLIYRNVDTPFTYTEDQTIFPHMPMDTAGFDCRAPRILGEWMVSIPALRKHPELEENALFVMAAGFEKSLANWDGADGTSPTVKPDAEAQPYYEVKPGDEKYKVAAYEAKKRLDRYKNGERYNYCPDTSDVVDDDVVRGETTDGTPEDKVGFAPGSTTEIVYPLDGVPDHAHWISTDFSDASGDWAPRRLDWPDILALKKFGATETPEVQAVVETLQNIRITDKFRSFATSLRPFGLYKEKPDCRFDNVPKVSSFTGSKRPRWFDVTEPEPEAPVYEVSAGAALFNMICVNCHGPKADSGGRQADTIMLLTGGKVRVANLRDGLLGPTSDPGANKTREFAPRPERDKENAEAIKQAMAGVGSEDWAARYLVFMGLGGTLQKIPRAILGIVGNTEVVGETRDSFNASARSANMLSTAVELCHLVVPRNPNGGSVPFLAKEWAIDYDHKGTLITSNGDAELWEELCTFDNLPPVRGLSPDFGLGQTEGDPIGFNIRDTDIFPRTAYPSDARVGLASREIVTGLPPDDPAPWCMVLPDGGGEDADLERELAIKWIEKEQLPLCPEGLSRMTTEQSLAWATRGAINAGLAVFLYMDQVAKGQPPALRYDQCEQLPKD